MKNYLFFICITLSSYLYAQEYFPINNGVRTTHNSIIAFTNATIVTAPGETVEKGTMVISKGKITQIGNNIQIPANAIVIDLKDKWLYPSFIEVYSDFGINSSSLVKMGNSIYAPNREGYYWSDHIKPDQQAIDYFNYDKEKAKALLKSGFGVVNTHVNDGIIQGTGVLVALNNYQDNNYRIIDQNSSQFYSFHKSKLTKQSYPTSLMGAMALIRQFNYDVNWYKEGNSPTKDLAIEAYLDNKKLPQIFNGENRQNTIRANKISNEFGLNFVLKGGGNEYERIDEVVNTKASYIIPLNFPEAYDVSDPYVASDITLSDMLYWNQAPTNLKVLEEHKVEFALTTSENKKPEEFIKNLRKSISYGYNEINALKALTTTPAKILGKDNSIGALKKGFLANFLITSGPIFDKETILYENWVQGNQTIINDSKVIDIRGSYHLSVLDTSYQMTLKGALAKPSIELKKDTLKIKSKLTYNNGWVTINVSGNTSIQIPPMRLSAIASDSILNGSGYNDKGEKIIWTAIKIKAFEKGENKKTEKAIDSVLPVMYPNMAYGFNETPKQQTVLFKNATVWTNEAQGILKNTDVLVVNGKIKAIGPNLSNETATVIDATGKHLTCGIIDEHSHIGVENAVNEAGQNSSAEVSIQDVLDPKDVNLYYNLSGGVTTIQLLHGSANPIGGQSAIIKPKWGLDADELLIKDAPKFIKFALGENVKQSNWGNGRFPQTRMGVEQVFIDYFQRAKEYDAKWKKYNNLSKKEKAKAKAPRYDLELQTLAEIINKERFITCHSYVQSEINMLMKVAEQFNFNVNTFTHILEGYKVADKMKEHGVGGSTFADWWAYKFEVNDAIPYNAAIMHNAGIVVAINSDDAEMSRRLNQEAAKTVKYGDITEEEAWKMVTLNPAILLHLDDKIGSIKVGKDADLVLWSDNPLSIYAIAEKTMIEGTFYYDYKAMTAQKEQLGKTKNFLIHQMNSAKEKGEKTQTPKKKIKTLMHCNTL